MSNCIVCGKEATLIDDLCSDCHMDNFWRDRAKDTIEHLESELDEMDAMTDGIIPEPSAELERWNALSDRLDKLKQQFVCHRCHGQGQVPKSEIHLDEPSKPDWFVDCPTCGGKGRIT